jgi:ribonuclease D
MGNEDLIRISERSVEGQAFSTPRMSARRRKSFEVVLALALQIPESEWPKLEKVRRKRPPKEQLARLEQIRTVRDRVASELNLDPSIVAPRQALEAAAEDPSTDALMPWQKALLGLPESPRPLADAA